MEKFINFIVIFIRYIIPLVMAIAGIFGGEIVIGLIFAGIFIGVLYYDNKNKIALKKANVSSEELDKEKERREKLLNELNNTKQEPKIEEKTFDNNDYDKWVKEVKAYKGYEGKDFFTIENVGLIWYEKQTYYLYLIDTSKKAYKKYGTLYKNGVMISSSISVNREENVSTEVIHHNSKLKGSIIGGVVAGTTGAIIGSNVKDKPDEYKQTCDITYYLIIDNERFKIEYEDYQILKALIDKNK